MVNILVDTGFWLALYNKRDKHHGKATQWMMDNLDSNYRFVTSWVVMCETFFLIKNVVSFKSAVLFLDSYGQSAFDVLDIPKNQSSRIIEVIKKYENLDIDLADASLVILAELLDTGNILTVDVNDFDVLRWKRTKRFKRLMQY